VNFGALAVAVGMACTSSSTYAAPQPPATSSAPPAVTILVSGQGSGSSDSTVPFTVRGPWKFSFQYECPADAAAVSVDVLNELTGRTVLTVNAPNSGGVIESVPHGGTFDIEAVTPPGCEWQAQAYQG